MIYMAQLTLQGLNGFRFLSKVCLRFKIIIFGILFLLLKW